MRKPIADDLCGHQNSKKIHTILISYSWPLYKGIASQPTRTGEIITTIVCLKLGLNILPNVMRTQAAADIMDAEQFCL